MDRVWPVNTSFKKVSWSNPRTSFLFTNIIFKHFVCFSFIFGTFGNKQKAFRTASPKEHECVKVILLQTNMPEQRVINWPIEMQRSCSERGKSQNNGLVTSALFFSSPRLAPSAKCCVRLAWLIKRLLWRLLSLHNMPYMAELEGRDKGWTRQSIANRERRPEQNSETRGRKKIPPCIWYNEEQSRSDRICPCCRLRGRVFSISEKVSLLLGQRTSFVIPNNFLIDFLDIEVLLLKAVYIRRL